MSKNAFLSASSPLGRSRKAGAIPVKGWVLIFKWAVFLAALAYLYEKVLRSSSLEGVKHAFAALEFSLTHWLFLGTASALMLVNWGIESAKWRTLMLKLERMPYWRSVAAVLAGNAISLWMPNRAGEYIGRVALLRPRTRIRGILAALVGGFAQLAVTLVMGMLGLVYYIRSHWDAGPYVSTAAGAIGVLFALFLLILYFNLNKVRYVVKGTGWKAKLKRYLSVYSIYNAQDLGAVLGLSFLRYLVFSSQLALMLYFFGVPVDVWQVLTSIFLIFLVQTAVPTTALTELAVRGSAAIAFLELPQAYDATVLAATYSIWLLNIILPSLAGASVLLFIRLSRSSKAGQ